MTIQDINRLRNFIYKQDMELKSLGLMTEHLITNDQFGIIFTTKADTDPIIRIRSNSSLDKILNEVCAYYVGLKRAVKLFIKK